MARKRRTRRVKVELPLANTLVVASLTVIVILLTALLFQNYGVPFLVQQGVIQPPDKIEPNPNVVGDIEATLPIRFELTSKYGLLPINVQIDIYTTNGVKIESGTIPSFNNVYLTQRSYTSGETLWIYLSVGNVKKTYEFIVPKVKDNYIALGYNGGHKIEIFSVGTYNMMLTDDLGNNIASGSIISSSLNPLRQYTFTMIQTVDGAGYMSSFDMLDGLSWNAVLEIEVSGTDYDKVLIDNIVYSTTGGQGNNVVIVERGLKRYYLIQLDDEIISRMKSGNNLILDGVFLLNFEVDAQPLVSAGGGSATITLTLWFYADVNEFVERGTYGGDEVQIASFSFSYN